MTQEEMDEFRKWLVDTLSARSDVDVAEPSKDEGNTVLLTLQSPIGEEDTYDFALTVEPM